MKGALASGPQIDPERRIAGLETQLAEVEIDLQSASELRDVEKVAALGKEYDQVRLELEQAWEQWGE